MKTRNTLVFVVVSLLVVSLLGVFVHSRALGSPRSRAEREHGIGLPPSAAKIQCRGDASYAILDRGASTLFEMQARDLNAFLSQLTINSRSGPAKTGPGNPCINGRNVWPTDSDTYVPGDSRYGGFKATWQGPVIPSQMLNCASPTGDWLHVELWTLDTDRLVVKLYTDWN